MPTELKVVRPIVPPRFQTSAWRDLAPAGLDRELRGAELLDVGLAVAQRLGHVAGAHAYIIVDRAIHLAPVQGYATESNRNLLKLARTASAARRQTYQALEALLAVHRQCREMLLSDGEAGRVYEECLEALRVDPVLNGFESTTAEKPGNPRKRFNGALRAALKKHGLTGLEIDKILSATLLAS